MKKNCENLESCHQSCHGNSGDQQSGHESMAVYKVERVFKALVGMLEEKQRPLCLADFKEYFDVREKRDIKSGNGWRDADKMEHALRRLFKRGRISRSEELVKIEEYPAT